MATSLTNTSSCITEVEGYKVVSVCTQSSETASVLGDTPIAFNFNPQDVSSITTSSTGDVTINFATGQSATLVGYADMVAATGQSEIMYNDGSMVSVDVFSLAMAESDESGTSDQGSFVTVLKPTVGTNTYSVDASKKYASDFTDQDVANAVVNEMGDVVLTFTDGTQTTLTNYTSVQNVDEIPTMTLADGTVINLTDILALNGVNNNTQNIDDIIEVIAETQIIESQDNGPDIASLSSAESLAAIEPAAGDAAAGPIQNTGAGFGSSVASDDLNGANAVGPIGATSLSFDLPELAEERVAFEQANAVDPTPTPVVRAPSLVVNNPIIKEDGSGDLYVDATLQSLNTTETLTVIVENLDASWTVTTGANNGTYDASAGTWTITMPEGENYTGTINLAPPADSDVDMTNIKVRAVAGQVDNSTSEVEAFVDATVDAVVDQPTLNANGITGTSGVAHDLSIKNAVTDADGSETLGDVTISGLPSGFSLNAGTEQQNGDWVVAQSDLSGLQMKTPAGYKGTFDLSVSVTATDNPTDAEVDTTDNVTTVTTAVFVDLNVQNASKPTVGIDGQHQVLEDNSVTVPFTASLGANALSSEVLMVTMSGVPSDWTVTTGANNGTYDASTGTWTITMPANTDYDGSLTFTPPADSDADLSELKLTATATQGGNGSSSSTETTSSILVDAVADMPNLDATTVASIDAGQTMDLNIANSLTDTDGSETLGDITISGLPSGFSLNAGTEQQNGDWVVSQSDISGLKVNVPGDAVGDLTLKVSVTSTEEVTDKEFDLTNNTATNTDTVSFTVVQNDKTPDVTFGEAGSNGAGEVYEDGSVFIPITATLNGDTSQILTVTVCEIPSDWTIATGGNNGTYDASTGTWTITMPANTNYDGGLTFTPPANSDVDVSGINVKAEAKNTVTNNILEGSTSGQIIVDAVADMPKLTADDVTGFDGQTISLNIDAALTDTDGSETLSVVTISDMPSELTLTKGTLLANGDWEIDASDLANLQIIVPTDYSGSTSVSVSVTSDEDFLDNEFDLKNNTATNVTKFSVNIGDKANPPTLDVSGLHKVYEDGSVYVPIKATTTGSGAEVLTVSVSGVPSGWVITTGANNGTYDSSTGTWTIVMPQGKNYDGGLTLAPPADSDADLSNLRVTAKSEVSATNSQSSITELTTILVDAVADMPNLDVTTVASIDAGQTMDLNIANSLTDTDGSETLGDVTISGLPSGFSLNAGTEQQNGDWVVSQSDISGLKVNVPGDAVGDLTLKVSVTSTEEVTDKEFDLTNNTATNTDTVSFTVVQNDKTPDVTFGEAGSNGAGEVYEDGSVFIPITATLNGDTSQALTVTLTGISSSWTITTGANNGTYNASKGTWTITMPANTDYDGGLTFAPPADSDVDLSGLKITATAKNTGTGSALSSSTAGEIIVDAVADKPDLTVSSASGEEGTSISLNIKEALTDTDGSESLQKLQISNLPTGATLNKGTESNDIWYLNESDLSGLKINLADGSNGVYKLSVKAISEEKVTDEDFDLTNNTATNTKTLTLTVSKDDVPVIIDPSSPTSKESDLDSTNMITGKIVADFGDDANGAEFCIPTGGKFSATGAYTGDLSWNGFPVVVAMANDNTQYVGKANGKTIFSLKLEDDGDYTFKQYKPLDHASATNADEIINLNFTICAQDGDGDMTSSTLTVKVQDTGPVAKNDVVTMSSCDWVTMGNAITNYNQDNSGADSLSEENGLIEQVSFNGKSYDFADSEAQSMSVDGKYGTLYIFKTGEYTYVSGQSTPKESQTEVFNYKLVDQDGDYSTAKITVNVEVKDVSTNPLSIYIYDLTNTTISGKAAYQIQNKNGAFILADEKDDVLAGNSGDDGIFGWTGDDILYGYGGNDILNGEQDNNTLYGGSGADMFKIHGDKSTNNNYDTIKDFDMSEGDVIDIQDLLSGYDANDNIDDFVQFSDTASGTMLKVNEDGKGTDFKNVAFISDHADLDASTLKIADLVADGHLDVY